MAMPDVAADFTKPSIIYEICKMQDKLIKPKLKKKYAEV